MTFDLAQMIADREAGTPGEFSQTGLTVYALMPWGWKRGVEQFCNRFSMFVQKGPGVTDDEMLANARRIASVPSMEAEIERLTARVAELEGALGFYVESENWKINGQLDDNSANTVAIPARAALSTPTEEPKT